MRTTKVNNRAASVPLAFCLRSLDRPPSPVYFRLYFAMLSDREAEEIERGRREKVGGPIVLKWIDQLSC
jgi:hypothetical protein